MKYKEKKQKIMECNLGCAQKRITNKNLEIHREQQLASFELLKPVKHWAFFPNPHDVSVTKYCTNNDIYFVSDSWSVSQGYSNNTKMVSHNQGRRQVVGTLNIKYIAFNTYHLYRQKHRFILTNDYRSMFL